MKGEELKNARTLSLKRTVAIIRCVEGMKMTNEEMAREWAANNGQWIGRFHRLEAAESLGLLLAKARAQGMRDAAEICGRLAVKSLTHGQAIRSKTLYGQGIGSEKCADAIRAQIENERSEGENG